VEALRNARATDRPEIGTSELIDLQIYVERSDRLDRVAQRMPAVRAPTLVPLQNPLKEHQLNAAPVRQWRRHVSNPTTNYGRKLAIMADEKRGAG